MPLLEYENQVFLDSFHEDGLVIMPRGLGLERIFSNLLKVYCDPGTLVLVLNTSTQEEEYFIEKISNASVKPLPKVITAEYSAADRHRVYMEGGVCFVTSRILVVDLLTDKLPVDLVTGILVYKAHKIMESCQEAFILRLYRQKNKKGFIKAFSDHPQAFTAGFCHVERVMKSLFVRKLFLWPRFHMAVVSCMEKNKIDVVELHIQMTPAMIACQTAILDLINDCIKELKRGNPTLDTEEITVENSITKGFETLLRLHLDPVWHQLSSKAKQLVSDLKTLRLMLQYLTQCDCVSFYNLVNSIRSSEQAFGKNSGWLFMDAADSLLIHAQERIFGPAQTKSTSGGAENSTKKQSHQPEECPKWKALSEVLEEVEEENRRLEAELGPGHVLVVASDDKTCTQIKQYLCEGGPGLMTKLFNKSVSLRKGFKDKPAQVAAPVKGKGKQKTKNSSPVKNGLTLTQMIDPQGSDEEDYEVPEEKKVVSSTAALTVTSDTYKGIVSSSVIIIYPAHGSSDPMGLVRTLEELKPRFVVLYDADMVCVRQLEVFKATHPGHPLRVYFLMYTASTEEQRYLTTLRKEKEAFEFLIREKASMVVPEEREGKLDDDPSLTRDVTPANATVNTRKGGVEKPPEQQRIIVDMREFRSELPSLIHRRGIDIEPVTLEVGDYILTPEICVERKSVSDLIGSLNNGRLYNQAVSMCRFYKRPVLLIEFDPNKSFALQGKYTISSEINSNDTMSKLTLLTLHFPRLRILWCQSPYATAELFEELKVGREQPDATTALTITDDLEAGLASGKYSHGPQDMLLKMPGINSKNIITILKNVENIAELATMSEERLAEILGSSVKAQQLHQFLHSEHTASESAVSTKPATSKSRGKLFKGIKRKR